MFKDHVLLTKPELLVCWTSAFKANFTCEWPSISLILIVMKTYAMPLFLKIVDINLIKLRDL